MDRIDPRIFSAPPVRGAWCFWRRAEDAILRENYASPGGPRACLAQLPERSLSSVYARARLLGLRGVHHVPERAGTRKYTRDPLIDGEIRRVYTEAPTRGAVNALARRVMRPRHWVSNRAEVLGLIVPRFKEPPWSTAEHGLLRTLAHHLPPTIARKFRERGFHRSATAIVVMRKRQALDLRDPDHYAAHQLAGLMGVDGKTVTRWIFEEGLPAARRGTRRVAAQGGDSHWIGRKSLRTWIASHAQLIDLRKVDRFWFIDLMAHP